MQCQKLKTYMETGRVVFLPAKAIVPNPAQPRKLFREEALDELAESIRRIHRYRQIPIFLGIRLNSCVTQLHSRVSVAFHPSVF